MRAQSTTYGSLHSDEISHTRFPFPPLEATYKDPLSLNGDDEDVRESAMDDVDNLMENDSGNASLITPGSTSGDFSGLFKSDDLVRQRASHDDDWWTLCQIPVLVVLFAVVGVLTVTFLVLLWLKSQMLESEKDACVNGGEPAQKMICPCPTHETSNDDRWIYHTVINLKCGTSASDAKPAIPIQPQESCAAAEPIVDKSSLAAEAVSSDQCMEACGTATPPPPSLTPEKRPEVVRVRAKGLLERRGSNVSLTIDLPQSNSDTPAHIITPTRECSAEEFLLSAGNTLCRAQLRSCLRDVGSLHREFWDIPLNHPEESQASGLGSSGKNRYKSILPNEKTRVCLQDPAHSYINANYIRGYDGEEKVYIATQGPLGNTVTDLYYMLWTHNCPVIAMMTHLVEKTKPKCEPYFPLGLHEATTYGPFDVTVEDLVHKHGYVVRQLLVKYKGESRRVLHYWYDTWPDHKTPQNTQAILAMAIEIEGVRTNLKNPISPNNCESRAEGAEVSGPVIVHCSAGIGRTGCFIAISIAICQLLEESKVDLLGIVCQMRYDRGGMIQTAEQYEFVHRAIATFEATLPESTPAPSSPK